MLIPFDNTYSQLPGVFGARNLELNSHHPSLIAFNEELAAELGIDRKGFTDAELAEYFSFTKALPGSAPLAMAYAGHQFGHFVPQLGDGRALLLGDFKRNGKRFDVHLKGSGRTFFSRSGDGKSAIGPVLREYLVSEGMHALGIPTTRTLCAVRTNEMVQREEVLPGAVMARTAQGHIRVGTFEYFASRGDGVNLKILADYAIERLYPETPKGDYLSFWKAVALKQMKLVAQWMSVGFIHGVMNTDNMSISGETIDYGPCAFMDEFSVNKVFSSIDRRGRYAFSNQPVIAVWNLARFAECLIPLLGDPETLAKVFTTELESLPEVFQAEYDKLMGEKLGFSATSADRPLIKTWLDVMEKNSLDFTLSFIDLENILAGRASSSTIPEEFLVDLKAVIALRGMKPKNPLTIPRNHLVERAIRASERGDDSLFFEMLEAIKKPFARPEDLGLYQLPPKPQERVLKTFCGT